MGKRLTPSQEKWLKEWEETRKKKWKFVVIEGIVFAILVPTVNIAIMRLVNGVWYSLGVILLNYAIGILGGLLFGLYMWWVYEKQYKKFLERKNNNE